MQTKESLTWEDSWPWYGESIGIHPQILHQVYVTLLCQRHRFLNVRKRQISLLLNWLKWYFNASYACGDCQHRKLFLFLSCTNRDIPTFYLLQYYEVIGQHLSKFKLLSSWFWMWEVALILKKKISWPYSTISFFFRFSSGSTYFRELMMLEHACKM